MISTLYSVNLRSMHPLVEKLLERDPRALARLMTLVENRSDEVFQIMKEIQGRCGRAHTVGITGPPGVGKSTLVDKMIHHYRNQKRRVGVVAIDPSSPFSGGALMGDRIRMQDHAGDSEVFIRSLGTRGSHGGLSRATREIIKLFDAYGMDEIIVETVGVGQTELGIMAVAETTVVVLTPESGDTIQTMKAGLLEIADIFVVNKADREGAERMIQELTAMVSIGGVDVPVLSLQAFKGIGVEGLMATIEEHRDSLKADGSHQGRQEKLAQEEAREIVLEEIGKQLATRGWIQEEGGENPYESAERILSKISF